MSEIIIGKCKTYSLDTKELIEEKYFMQEDEGTKKYYSLEELPLEQIMNARILKLYNYEFGKVNEGQVFYYHFLSSEDKKELSNKLDISLDIVCYECGKVVRKGEIYTRYMNVEDFRPICMDCDTFGDFIDEEIRRRGCFGGIGE